MEINETINKWFNETNKLIGNEIEDFNSIDGLCQAVLHSSNDYCCAVLFLLQRGYVMPAKALLRCLCELSVKLNWCLSVPDNISDKEDDQIVKDKIRRWEKDTLCNNIEALEKFRNVVDDTTNQKIQQETEKLKLEPLFSDKRIKRLPQFKNITDQLPNIFRNEVYPLLYLQFNNAIHLDVTSLVDAYKAKNKKESQHNSKMLIEYCVTHALHINTVIRMSYGIDTNSVKQEFHNIIKDLDVANACVNK